MLGLSSPGLDHYENANIGVFVSMLLNGCDIV